MFRSSSKRRLQAAFKRLTGRRRHAGTPRRVRVEKTETGWLVYFADPDPEKRYAPVPQRRLDALIQKAEEEYAKAH